MADKRIRVLVAKPGLDGHDRGANAKHTQLKTILQITFFISIAY